MSMMMNKRKALYGLLLGAALLGLLIDRLQRGGASAAGPTARAVRPVAVVRPPSPAPLIAAIFAVTDSRPVEDRSPGGPLRNAFACSPEMLSHYKAAAGPAPKPPEQQAAERRAALQAEADLFAGAHQLKGVQIAGQGRWAMIDGQVLRVGQRLEGWTLRQIDHYRVVFTRPGGKLELRLPEPFKTQVSGQ